MILRCYGFRKGRASVASSLRATDFDEPAPLQLARRDRRLWSLDVERRRAIRIAVGSKAFRVELVFEAPLLAVDVRFDADDGARDKRWFDSDPVIID